MNVPITKNQQYTMTIVDMGSQGEGIGKIDDFTVFVPNAVTGDEIEVKILKVKKNYAYGKLMQILSPSPKRQNPKCPVAHMCGGCQLQHVTYEEQLQWKTERVKSTLMRIGGLKDITVSPTLGMKEPYYYRNKAQFPVSMEDGKVKIGFYATHSHRIVPTNECLIQDRKNKEIIEAVKNFIEKYNISVYDENKHEGLIRHLVTKTAFNQENVMVCFVINGDRLPHDDKLIEALKNIKGITSIVLNHNKERTNVILGDEITVLYGEDFIIDSIGDLKFKISPLSFFQVNPIQTKVLYDKVLEYAELNGSETVWDAYCGIGTISLFLAQKAKKVYGVEIVSEAIRNAKENAALNGITNAEFFEGQAEEVIPRLYKEEGIKADIIVVDPPRKGCDQKLLETIISMAPEKMVYVSCDPATLARDLAYLTSQGYRVEKVQPVDMFPHTVHVECVTLMSRVEK